MHFQLNEWKGVRTATLLLFLSWFLLACSENSQQKSQAFDKATLYFTTLDQKHLLEEQELVTDSTTAPDFLIPLDSATTFQDMDGFGFTLTGGSALLLQGLSDSVRTALLHELFGTGAGSIGISYLRVSVGASDLDEKPWSYDDLPKGRTDIGLETFSLAYDTLYLIPTLKEILKIAPDIKLMGSPWSPPTWMKDNGDTRGGSLKPEYYATYAQYLAKYIQAMSAQGITIDALTVQNEPLHPGNNPSLLMLAEEQSEFIKNHLGPSFEDKGITTKIVLYDHNADRPDYPISILNDPQTARFVDGSAFHLYGGSIDALTKVHEAHPDKNLYFTEQWIGAPWDFASDFTWHIENLIIGAPRNWAKTVLEWNLAADENQEPHTDRGGCVGCLGALTIQGDVIKRNPAYYIIAHASKFVPPGSVRIASEFHVDVPNVAYIVPSGKIVVLLQNKNNARKTVSVSLKTLTVPISLEAGAVGTLILQ